MIIFYLSNVKLVHCDKTNINKNAVLHILKSRFFHDYKTIDTFEIGYYNDVVI